MTPGNMQLEIRKVGLAIGPAMAGAMLVAAPPEGLSREGWAAAAVAVLMAVWWMTEALPIAITALLPPFLLPLLEVSTIREASSAYADPLVLLLFGGFVLAAAIERWSPTRTAGGAAATMGRARSCASSRRVDGCDRVPQHVGEQHRLGHGHASGRLGRVGKHR